MLKKFFARIYGIIKFILTLLFNVVVFPFKVLIIYPFRALRRAIHFFMKEEPPEDRPLIDTLADLRTEAETQASLWDHIEALRLHVLRAAIAFAICCIISFLYVDDILSFLQAPLNLFTDAGLRISGPGNIFDILPQVIFASAFVLFTPYLIFEIFLFAVPGLTVRARKIGLALQFIFLVFSFMSLAVGYYLILPNTLSVALALTSRFGIYDWELFGYLSFTMKILILSAIIVYYPFIVYLFIARFNKPRIPLRIIVLVSFCLAAAVTPGTMVLIDFGLTAVLSIIYIPTYLALMLLYRPPRKVENEGGLKSEAVG